MTKEQLRSKPFAPRKPHVVLLGAGASKAAMASLYGVPAEYLGPFRTDSLSELQDWHGQIADAEKEVETEADHLAET